MQQFGGPCFGAVASEGIFMKKFAFAVAAIALPASANAVPFVNGSFETGPATTRFTTLDPGSTAMTGWTVGGGGVDYIGGYWNAQNGSRSVDLSGGAPGSISQTFDTIAGQGYTVTFYLSGNGDNGVGPRTASVNATGSATTSEPPRSQGHHEPSGASPVLEVVGFATRMPSASRLARHASASRSHSLAVSTLVPHANQSS